MQSMELEYARRRLRNAPWRSQTTDRALHLLEQSPSDTALIESLSSSEQAPVALEVFSALGATSETVFQAVRSLIHAQPLMSWCLVETLNRLAWYDGMRAFLSLPETPTASPCAYPFYMLVRNKVFIPPNLGGEIYRYYVNGLWQALPVARAGNWQKPPHPVRALVEMLARHFDNGAPDPFVLYFSCLLLGRFAPLDTSLRLLREFTHSDGCPTVRRVAALTLDHLAPGQSREPCCQAISRSTCRKRLSM